MQKLYDVNIMLIWCYMFMQNLRADFGRLAKFNFWAQILQDPVDESRNLNCVLGEMQDSVHDCDDWYFRGNNWNNYSDT